MRDLNPHAAAALDDWRRASGGGGGATAPRALAAAPGLTIDGCLVGASSFGMSGVNAHAVVGAAPGGGAIAPPSLPWRHTRAWHGPHPHRLVMPAQGGGGATALFSARLDAPSLAWLRDHVVRGRPLLPAAASLEAASAAAAMLLYGGRVVDAVPAVTGVAFLAPVSLGTTTTLSVSMSLADGSIAVGSAVRAVVRSVRQSVRGGRALPRRLGRKRPLAATCAATARLARAAAAADYATHPARLDAALHLEALRRGDASAHVPVTVAAVTQTVRTAWAVASPAASRGAGAVVAGLTSAALGRDVKPAAPRASHFVAEWQVVDVAAARVGGQVAPATSLALPPTSSPVAAAAAMLRGVVDARSTALLSTGLAGADMAGPAGVGPSVAAAAAAAAALRVAASEGAAPHASVTWHASNTAPPSLYLPSDEFGVAIEGGAARAHHLTPLPPPPSWWGAPAAWGGF